MKNLFLSFAILLLCVGQSCKSNTKSRNVELASLNLEEKALDSVGRKLKKEATINFETRDYNMVCLEIRNLIKKHSGQIIKETGNKKENNTHEASFETRIPAKSFDLFLQELEAVHGKIVNKEINVEDITAQYIDMEARLKSKKELETRYIQLLSKASKVTEMLEIEKQLNNQRTEIESIEGEFKFMQHEVANNLLNITVTETKTVTSGFFGKVLESLSDGWSFFVTFIIGLLTLWPFILLILAIVYFVLRYNRQQIEKMKALKKTFDDEGK